MPRNEASENDALLRRYTAIFKSIAGVYFVEFESEQVGTGDGRDFKNAAHR